MTIRYYRGPWPHDEVPDNEPIWFLYEVDVEFDHVLRMVEVFRDGSANRNSLDIEARHGPKHDSLNDQPFVQDLEAMELAEITSKEFEDAWGRGADTPFWNAPGNRFPPFS
jgi:hypothetical protein